MVTFSKTYTGEGGRSNARRAARAAGVAAELVQAHEDGFRFPLNSTADQAKPSVAKPAVAKRAVPKPANAPAPFVPDFRFGAYQGAHNASEAQRKNCGLEPGAFVVAVRYDAAGVAKYAFVPKHRAEGLVVVTGDMPRVRMERSKKETRERQPKRARKAANGGSKVDLVREMICRKDGAYMKDICAETGWLPHTARARISGIVAKHGLTIERQRFMGDTRYTAKPAA